MDRSDEQVSTLETYLDSELTLWTGIAILQRLAKSPRLANELVAAWPGLSVSLQYFILLVPVPVAV